MLKTFLLAALLCQQAPKLTQEKIGPQRDPLTGVTIQADGKTLLTTGRTTSTLWNLETKKEIGDLGSRFYTTAGGLCRNGKIAATLRAGNFSGDVVSRGMILAKVTLVDPETRKEAESFSYEARGIYAYRLGFSPDGKYLACGDVDELTGESGQDGTPGGKLVIWETSPPKQRHVIPGNVVSIDFSPDGKLVACAGYDRSAKVISLDTGKVLKTFTVEMGEINSVRFSPDSQILVAGCVDHTVRTWNVKTGRPIRALNGHALEVTGAIFSPDAKRIYSCSTDETVRVWDAEKGKELQVVKGLPKGGKALDLHPEGKFLAVVCGDGTVRFVEGLGK